MTSLTNFKRQMEHYVQRHNNDGSMKSTVCPVCTRPFYLPFRWGKECPHTVCLECLWKSLQAYDENRRPSQPSHDPITACPICRSTEYEFEFDEEMEQYMLTNSIDPERTSKEYQALHIRFLYICMCGVNPDSVMIVDLDDELNKVVFADRDLSSSSEPAIPDALLVSFDTQLKTPQPKNFNDDPTDQKINALLNLRDHIPVRKLRGHLQRVQFAAPNMQGELVYNIPNYYKW
ncbi:hypothetical protein AJ80_09309 [Polytolypa hystricis UAMH7299]|uniref:RING-type domain-containing protein n=1 Tax=Polytolypa hystricis (strain UAMH7299) TaxID=1447883 RepID=A0A2B7WSD6_POLH7|nr:hypothetical protein AJ80_09309 [Polytolypa hystricis UAMH7299]